MSSRTLAGLLFSDQIEIKWNKREDIHGSFFGFENPPRIAVFVLSGSQILRGLFSDQIGSCKLFLGSTILHLPQFSGFHNSCQTVFRRKQNLSPATCVTFCKTVFWSKERGRRSSRRTSSEEEEEEQQDKQQREQQEEQQEERRTKWPRYWILNTAGWSWSNS